MLTMMFPASPEIWTTLGSIPTQGSCPNVTIGKVGSGAASSRHRWVGRLWSRWGTAG